MGKIYQRFVKNAGRTRNVQLHEDIDFMTEQNAASLIWPHFFSHALLWSVLAIVVIGLIWASLAKVDEITVAEGKVVPSSQIQVIQNLEGGIVSKTMVQVGQVVKKGQLLMQLDKTRFSSSDEENQGKLDSLQAKIARLTAEAYNKPFEAPPQLLKAKPEIVEHEQSLYMARQQELNSNISVLQQQAGQRSQEIIEKRARETQLQQSLKLVTQELAITRPLMQQGVASEVEVLRLERQVNDLKGDLDSTRIAIPRLSASVQEMRNRIEGLNMKFRSDAMNELSQARNEFASSSAIDIAIGDRLARTAIRSPVNGIIKQIKVNTVGGVTQPGMELMEIVPIEDNLLIEARVRPSDIAFLRPGQEATVKISAYDYSIFGGFPAVLELISADTITNEKGDAFYLITVRTKVNNLTKSKEQMPIIPGMLATVDIKTGKKTILDFIIKPIIKTKERALRER
ncbi:MAG: HlyD family type I secretion periplasmic adaptor subunit [Sulfuricellaceae bacterium]|nr:HlyD family type I secretion periplasmic adaptor subunit [Sulfuricellaceae bacterium]